METKSSGGPSASFDTDTNDNEAPPSYSDTISSFPITSSPSCYYRSQISSQLLMLTSQISSLQTQNTLQGHAQEEKILACLTTHIQTYLSDFASTGLKKGTLILIPANGLKSKDARPTDSYFRNPNDYDRMVRIRGKDDDDDDATKGSWFWQDENMAERLARCLTPAQHPRTRELPLKKEQIRVQEKKKDEGRGFWSWKKSVMKTPIAEERRDEKIIDLKGGDRERESSDRVVFDVRAEEVSFRSTNSLGLYELEKGFGIVLRLRVVLG